jgi:hypothetical protein
MLLAHVTGSPTYELRTSQSQTHHRRLDDQGLTVRAQYNPKELQVDQAVPWKKPDSANKTGTQAENSGGGDDGGIAREFTGAEGRSMSVEMLFDGYEPGNGRAVKVAAQVAIRFGPRPEVEGREDASPAPLRDQLGRSRSAEVSVRHRVALHEVLDVLLGRPTTSRDLHGQAEGSHERR